MAKINPKSINITVYTDSNYHGKILHVEVDGFARPLRTASELWYLLQLWHDTGELKFPAPELPRPLHKQLRKLELQAQETWLANNPGKARRAPPPQPSIAERLKKIEDLL